MRHLHRLFRITLLMALGVLALGAAALAQDAGFEVLESDPVAEAGAPAELFDKLDAALAALDESVLTVATDDEVAQIAEEVTALLRGTDEEPGLIALVQEVAGVASEDLIDAEAVVAGGIETPEVTALAHLILAANAIGDFPTSDSLLTAAEHVREADSLLAGLRGESAADEDASF